MAFRKLPALVGLSALVGALVTSQIAWADVGSANSVRQTPERSNVKTLIALGDSITFGLYLPSTSMTTPSPDAFPSLIANDENLQVDNLGVPGWTSQDLLTSLTNSSTFQDSVRHAKVVTLDIGSNDLLSIASQDGILSSPNPTITPAEQQQFASAIQQFSRTLPAIVNRIQELSPSSKIVLYNLYNPIPSTAPQLFAFGESLIGAENVIISQCANQFQIPVADAYAAFAGHDDTYLIPGNVHPDLLGQQVLASLGEEALVGEHFHAGDWGEGDGQSN